LRCFVDGDSIFPTVSADSTTSAFSRYSPVSLSKVFSLKISKYHQAQLIKKLNVSENKVWKGRECKDGGFGIQKKDMQFLAMGFYET